MFLGSFKGFLTSARKTTAPMRPCAAPPDYNSQEIARPRLAPLGSHSNFLPGRKVTSCLHLSRTPPPPATKTAFEKVPLQIVALKSPYFSDSRVTSNFILRFSHTVLHSVLHREVTQRAYHSQEAPRAPGGLRLPGGSAAGGAARGGARRTPARRPQDPGGYPC